MSELLLRVDEHGLQGPATVQIQQSDGSWREIGWTVEGFNFAFPAEYGALPEFDSQRMRWCSGVGDARQTTADEAPGMTLQELLGEIDQALEQG